MARFRDDDDDDAFGPDGLLRDGKRARVHMMARDRLSDLQRAIAEDKATRVNFSDALCRHQPGPVSLTDRAGIERKARAYADSVRDLTEAWRTPSADPAAHHAATDAFNDREVARVHNTGDAVRDAYLDYVADLTSAWQRAR
jgi:hypothetical protein